MELYMQGDTRVSASEWYWVINGLREDVRDETGTKEELREALVNAIMTRARAALDRDEQIGVLFSGGVDCTLIALVLKQHDIPFTAYTIGFLDGETKVPEDIEESRRVAKQLGFVQKELLLSLDDAHALFKKSANILSSAGSEEGSGVQRVTVMSVGIGSVVVAGAELAQQDNCTTLFGGLGAEEIFAGYKQHEAVPIDELQERCWSGLAGMYERDLVRDCTLAEELGVTLLTPFLDKDVIVTAMRVPATEKIKEVGGVLWRKYVLRVIAEELGVPHACAFRPKRAAQYGSRLSNAMEKLARKNGFTTQQEYLQAFNTS